MISQSITLIHLLKLNLIPFFKNTDCNRQRHSFMIITSLIVNWKGKQRLCYNNDTVVDD